MVVSLAVRMTRPDLPILSRDRAERYVPDGREICIAITDPDAPGAGRIVIHCTAGATSWRRRDECDVRTPPAARWECDRSPSAQQLVHELYQPRELAEHRRDRGGEREPRREPLGQRST